MAVNVAGVIGGPFFKSGKSLLVCSRYFATSAIRAFPHRSDMCSALGAEDGTTTFSPKFKDERLLGRAVASVSSQSEVGGLIEFRGHSLLHHLATEHLWTIFPVGTKQGLSELHQAFTCERYLARLWRACEVNVGLEIPAGTEKAQAALFAAIVAAYYHDSGYRATQKFVRDLFRSQPCVPKAQPCVPKAPATLNAKGKLQQLLQRYGRNEQLAYVTQQDPGSSPHKPTFRSEVTLCGQHLGYSEGCRKKSEAENSAAEDALSRLFNPYGQKQLES